MAEPILAASRVVAGTRQRVAAGATQTERRLKDFGRLSNEYMNYGFSRLPKCASKFDFSGAEAFATEDASVDGRRRRDLVRRDKVEHLLMIDWQCCPAGSRSLVLIPIIECWSSVVTLDQVYDAIGQFPDGLTSKQIADFLGKSASQVSGLASKLFYYGKVDREFAPGYRRIYRYKPKK
jgi:hypothetical protein